MRSFIFPLTTALVVGLAHAAGPVVIYTTGPSIPTEEPEYVDSETFATALLNGTNDYRSQHNATAVHWNTTLAAFASEYLETRANCVFAHSGGPYGENIAIGYVNVTAAVEAWGDERKQYNFNNPTFSAQTGHFSQLVWKDTTQLGCARKLCGARGWYVVCEYWPRGNVAGQYKNEVAKEEESAGQQSNLQPRAESGTFAAALGFAMAMS